MPGQLERHETPDPARSDAVESRIQYVRWCVLMLPGAALGDRGAQEEAWRRGYPTGLPGHGQVVAVSPVLGDHAAPGTEPVGLGDGERLPGRRYDAVHDCGAGPEVHEVAGMAARHGHVQDHQVVALDGLVDLEAEAGECLAEPLGGGPEPGRPGLAGSGGLDGRLPVDRLRVIDRLEVLAGSLGHEVHAADA